MLPIPLAPRIQGSNPETGGNSRSQCPVGEINESSFKIHGIASNTRRNQKVGTCAWLLLKLPLHNLLFLELIVYEIPITMVIIIQALDVNCIRGRVWLACNNYVGKTT